MCFAVNSMKLSLKIVALGKVWVTSKTKVGTQSINLYVNSHGLMLIILFVWKSFTKPLKKLKSKTNIFWKIFYFAIYLKHWLTNIS